MSSRIAPASVAWMLDMEIGHTWRVMHDLRRQQREPGSTILGNPARIARIELIALLRVRRWARRDTRWLATRMEVRG